MADMWECDKCGCMEIAGSLTSCPACHAPRDVAAGPKDPGYPPAGIPLTSPSQPKSKPKQKLASDKTE